MSKVDPKSNVFAILRPYDQKNRATTAFRLPENASRFHQASGGVAEEPIINSREPTPALSLFSEGNVDDEQDTTDRLILTFSQPPKDPLRGWQFGTSEVHSDILLGHRGTKGISARQFHITVSEKGWIYLDDDRSSHGTAVGYDHEKQEEIRRKEKWILAHGPGSQIQWKDITIHAGRLVFKIEFPNQQAGQQEYRNNLRAFWEKSQAALPSVGALSFGSFLSTATPSRSQSPSQRAIYLNSKRIGSGEFGEVHRVIKARDGLYYAAKIFKCPFDGSGNSRKRKWNEKQWMDKIRLEIDIMRENPHANVMPVLDFQLAPKPTLIMPYYPDGHLGRHIGHLGEHHFVSALRQMLLGLRHLHERRIIHRDLKPENLLVKLNRFRNTLTLVIADFGLSKIGSTPRDLLRTFCGTLLYAAPEVYPHMSEGGYGANVDVWAAGVIILECIWGLPEAPAAPWRKEPRQQAAALDKWISTWTESLLQKLDEENENGDRLIELVLHMVDPDPETRYSADKCLQAACHNGLFKKGVNGGIVDTDEAAGTWVDPTSEASDADRKAAPAPPSPPLSETDTNKTTIVAKYFPGGDYREYDGASTMPSLVNEKCTCGRPPRRARTFV